VHGRVVQIDQAGRPGTNIIFSRAEADRAAFNEMPPAQQVASFGEKFEAVIRSLGYPRVEAAELVLSLLPDVLGYDPSAPGGCPDGRRLADDPAGLMIAMLSTGRVTGDGVGPRADMLDELPISAGRTRRRSDGAGPACPRDRPSVVAAPSASRSASYPTSRVSR
jgi:hypothetical protein